MILDACELMKLVGFSPSNEELDSWLTRHRIYGRPFIAAESEFFDEDRDRAARESVASEIEESGRHSIAIIYDRGDQYLPAIGNDIGRAVL